MPIYKMDGKKDGKQQYRVRINYTDNTGRARQIDRVAYGSTEAKLHQKNACVVKTDDTGVVRRISGGDPARPPRNDVR